MRNEGFKAFVLVLAGLVSLASFAGRTANQEWVKENFVSRTNEFKLAERRYALFILDLNAENAGKWRSFELKASTNNFARVEGGGEAANMVFWGCSDEADGYADGANPILDDRAQDRMRLYWLTTRKGGDGRAWSKISTTLDLTGANPKKLAVLISPELCTDADGSAKRTERSSGATPGPMRREPKRTRTARRSGIRWSRSGGSELCLSGRGRCRKQV